MTSANLAHNLAASAETHADRPAIILGDLRVSYVELDRAAQQLAGWLQSQGVGAGDRVALMLPNVPSFPIAYYGALRLGAIVVPMNPLFKRREIEFYLQDSGAKVIVAMPGDEVRVAAEATDTIVLPVGEDGLTAYLTGEHAAEPVSEITARDAGDTAVILYTSGTTGRPKGAELTFDNLQTNLRVTGRTLLNLTPDDVVMGCLPLFHVFGMTCGMNTAFEIGASLAMVPRFDPAAVVHVIETERVTIFEGVPTMYGGLLAGAAAASTPPDLSSLRTCLSGGASLPVELMRQFEETFGATILEGYGLSETSPVASFNQPHLERRPGSIGTPVPGVEMKLVSTDGSDVADGEVGEIAIRGENVMKGYWGRPDATAEAIRDGGWFYSGDLGRQDEDGYYYIVDRTKDVIIRGGYNVYPREIEELLYEHAAVAEAAVVGLPHPELGEEITAYVVLKPGTSASESELVEHVKSQVAPYKYPRTITLIPELPKGATGKILKRELRAR